MTLRETVALGDCCEIVSGATPSTFRPEFWNGDICWATPKDLSELDGAYIGDTPRKLTRVGLENCSATILPPNSVLFSSRAPIGHVAINTVPMATNQGFKSFVPDRARVDAKFLFRWLRFKRQYLESLGNGATFKEVSRAVVSRVKIPLPPLPEQRRIAAILDKADVLRAKRRAALAQLNGLTQSIFLEMFGDPDLNPHRWAVKRLAEICLKISDIDHNMPKAVEDGVPFISAKDLLEDGGLSFDGVKTISEEDFRRLSRKSKPERGDIIYSRIGIVGRARLVETERRFLASYSCCTIKPDRAVVDAVFLCHLLDSPFILRQAQKGVRAIAVPDLGMKEIKSFRVVVPPMSLQQEFARRISAASAIGAVQRCSQARLDGLFASLQQQAFAGAL